MKKPVLWLLASLVAVLLILTPVISSAVPGNGIGDGNAGGNGNHYGWDKGKTYDTPEPDSLLEVGVCLACLGGWLLIRRKMRSGD